MTDTFLITEKINEVRREMKSTGVWKNEIPAWVKEFEKRTITTGQDFCEWLQFIYLPNRKPEMTWKKEEYAGDYIAPQATKFFWWRY